MLHGQSRSLPISSITCTIAKYIPYKTASGFDSPICLSLFVPTVIKEILASEFFCCGQCSQPPLGSHSLVQQGRLSTEGQSDI